MGQTKLNKLCSVVAGLTDKNNHNQARIEIAKFFKFEKELNLLNDIKKKHESNGYMTHEDIDFRREITKTMFKKIDPKIAGLLWSCL